MRTLFRRAVLALLLLAAAGAGWLVVSGGTYLHHEDPLQKADAIFVLGGARAERWLEAYELYRDGYAPIILLSPERPEAAEALVRSRGITFPSTPELQRAALVQLGVPAAAVLIGPGTVDNTAQEAELLRAIAGERHWRRAIVVTAKLHTRRAGFAMRRGVQGTGMEIVMRASRYDAAQPGRWWRSRPDIRFGASEWIKLVLYRLGLSG